MQLRFFSPQILRDETPFLHRFLRDELVFYTKNCWMTVTRKNSFKVLLQLTVTNPHPLKIGVLYIVLPYLLAFNAFEVILKGLVQRGLFGKTNILQRISQI
jgi:hypothetical protein